MEKLNYATILPCNFRQILNLKATECIKQSVILNSRAYANLKKAKYKELQKYHLCLLFSTSGLL